MSTADTALALRSGEVPVLGTPRVVCLCEQACLEAVRGELAPGQTSVGTRVEVAHVSPVAVGSLVKAVATLEKAEGRRLTFNVSVTDGCGLVAAGRITRVVVDKNDFLGRAC